MNSTQHLLKVAAFLATTFLAAGATAQQKTSAVSGEEQYGLGDTRTVNTAEVTYASIYKTGYSANLLALGEGPSGTEPSAAHAGLITNELAQGEAHGYTFTYKPGAKDKDAAIRTYTLVARPMKWQKGRVSYFTDQTGVIRWTKQNRAPTAKDEPIDSLPGL